MKNKLTLLVIALNEIEGIKIIMPKIKKNWLDQIIIVDGGSSDGTVDWTKKNNFDVYIQKKKGFRHAYEEIFRKVTGNIIFTFSPDGNSIPELIPSSITEMN